MPEASLLPRLTSYARDRVLMAITTTPAVVPEETAGLAYVTALEAPSILKYAHDEAGAERVALLVGSRRPLSLSPHGHPLLG